MFNPMIGEKWYRIASVFIIVFNRLFGLINFGGQFIAILEETFQSTCGKQRQKNPQDL